MFQASRTTWLHNVILLVVVLISLTHVSCDVTNDSKNCAILYEKGIEAYLENNFKDCVTNFEKAVKSYNLYMKTLQNCRIECKEAVAGKRPANTEDIDDLYFYEKTIKNTLCILKCRNKNADVFGLYNINKETEELFEDRKPYEYLHICYFQIKDYQKAASSAFTYLVTHPDDKQILASLKYYLTFPKTDTNDVINFEAKEYVYLYTHGSDAYNNQNWDRVVQNMEESLIDYLHSEEECRAQCEGPFDPGWLPDFIPSIANHFTYCLKCKRRCRKTLSSLNGEEHDDLLASHYHYLQYAYYKLGKVKAACRAVASYLLFYPDNEDMNSNLKYYESLQGINASYFIPREEAVYYTKREAYEMKLLKYIQEEFNFKQNDLSGNTVDKVLNTEVIKNSKELNGTQRYLAENFLTNNQCSSLVYVSKLFAKIGDGYYGNKAPHTIHEIFGGISFSRFTFLVSVGLVDLKYLKILVGVTDAAKAHIEEYFNINNLYFSFTQLVCRAAITNSQQSRQDFSHKVHADNCNLKPNGSCEKAFPSYVSRDYSAIIYLNDNFIGGDFIFVSDYNGTIVQSSISPKCGKMVAFSSGEENKHAVTAISKGTRCAIGMWFTFNSSAAESHHYAHKLIEDGV